MTKSPWVDVADWTISLSHDGACTFTGGTTNSAATGAPSVSGTVRVGETLTAVTSGVADADGLGVFSYQWSADSSPISGATASTYTLVAADLGKAISVAVSFTDGGGNAESVASSPTAAVAAKPNSAATGAPSVSGTVRVGETLTAVTSGVADADGLGVFSYQWSADSSPISGATASTYTLVAADLGKAISVAVSFTDGGGNAESVASSPTAAVAAAEDSDDDDSDSGTATPAPTPHPVCGVAPSNGVIQGYPSYNRSRCGPTQWKEAADSSECTAVGRWKIADGEMLYICVRGWYARWMASNR
ncbi:MAG: hypothetical protein OXG67_02365 [bacterium]|nr:hypothetical protein [bacterium]